MKLYWLSLAGPIFAGIFAIVYKRRRSQRELHGMEIDPFGARWSTEGTRADINKYRCDYVIRNAKILKSLFICEPAQMDPTDKEYVVRMIDEMINSLNLVKHSIIESEK